MGYVLRLHLQQVNSDVEIPFDTLVDLEAALKAIDWQKLVDTVATNSAATTVSSAQASRPELEGISTVGAGGLPRFSKVPKSDAEYVGLSLFAVEPRHLLPDEIESATGVRRVTSNVLSHGHWKKYFLRHGDGSCSLSPEGKRWIIETVLPKLKA